MIKVGSKQTCVCVHYSDVIMSTMASQITSLTIGYSTIYSGTGPTTASLAFVRGIHRWLVNSPHKGPITRKMFSFDDVIMKYIASRGIPWFNMVRSEWFFSCRFMLFLLNYDSFDWIYIYIYIWLLHWHWSNHIMPNADEVILKVID